MKARKAAADDGAGKETGLVREWGKKPTATNNDEDVDPNVVSLSISHSSRNNSIADC